MTIKWKVFALANYIFGLLYFILLVYAMRFTVEAVPPSEDLTPFFPFLASLIIVVFNSVFNLYIFHFRLPDKPLSRRMARLYLVSTILFIISLIIIFASFFLSVRDELTSVQFDNSHYLLLTFFFLNLLAGIFILVNQLLLRKFIEKNNDSSLDTSMKED